MARPAEVVTVTGSVDPAALGTTSMHEHVLIDLRNYRQDPDPLAGRRAQAMAGPLTLENVGLVRRQADGSADNLLVDDTAMVTAELEDFRAAGGRTVVDMSCAGVRVDPLAVAAASRRSGVLVVAGTGLYVDSSRPTRFTGWEVHQLADWMVGELEEGIGNSGVRAGHIGELGVTSLDVADRNLLRAGVRAASRTGFSMSVHPGFEAGTDGRAIADLLESEGAAPERVVIAHADAFVVESSVDRLIDDPGSWTLRLDYHRELLARGYNLSFDCFGHDWGRQDQAWTVESDWQRLAGLLALLREGHAGQLLLGCDVCLHRRGGGAGYAHLLEWVLPTLRRHGIADETIDRLTVANPARLLARLLPG